jgi:hypothetical protein
MQMDVGAWNPRKKTSIMLSFMTYSPDGKGQNSFSLLMLSFGLYEPGKMALNSMDGPYIKHLLVA